MSEWVDYGEEGNMVVFMPSSGSISGYGPTSTPNYQFCFIVPHRRQESYTTKGLIP
jgi:hypothetical protein